MVPDEVFEAIQQAKAEGVKIVLCTGRPIGGVHRYLKELQLDQEGDYVIAYNGALVQNSHTNEQNQLPSYEMDMSLYLPNASADHGMYQTIHKIHLVDLSAMFAAFDDALHISHH